MFDDADYGAFTVPAPSSSSHLSPPISRSADEPEHQDGVGRGAPRNWGSHSEEFNFGVQSPPRASVADIDTLSRGASGEQPMLMDSLPMLSQTGDNSIPELVESPESSASPERWPVPSWLGWAPLPPVASRPNSRQPSPNEREMDFVPSESNGNGEQRPFVSGASREEPPKQWPPAPSRPSRGQEPPPPPAPVVWPPVPSRPSRQEQPAPSQPYGGTHVSAASSWQQPFTFLSHASESQTGRREVPVTQGSSSRDGYEPAPASQIGAPLNDRGPLSELETRAGQRAPDDRRSGSKDARPEPLQRLDSGNDWDTGEASGDGILLPIHQVDHMPHPGHVAKVEHHHTPIGRIFYECASAYAKNVPAKRPCCCACFGFFVVIVTTGVGMVLKPPTVETNFDSFMKTDVNSSTMRDGFMAALSERSDDKRRLRGATLYTLFDIFIAYELKEDAVPESIFDREVIAAINRFERTLTSQAAWQEYCATTLEETTGFCNPGISVSNYVMPYLETEENDVVPSTLVFDGKGKDTVPLGSTLRLLNDFSLTRLLLPLDYSKDSGPEAVQLVRSAFRFRFYCCQSTETSKYQRDRVREMSSVFDQFLKETVMPFLEDWGPGGSEADAQALPFNIWYTCNGLETIQVMQTLMGDIGLATGSMFFVLLYVIFHTRSIFLSLLGIFIVLFSVPFSYVVFAIVAGTNTMSIASFLSLFLVVGLGSDVIFVYTDFWRDSIRIRDSESDRIVWTLFYAGKASLATTITTALSFFANLASVLKPLREFGMFMGLCVMLVWVLVTVIFLPLCVVDERYFSRCTIRCANEGSSKFRQWIGMWEALIFRWRRSCLGFCLLFTLIALVFSALNVETDTQLPDIFPKEHNQNHGKQVMQRFESSKDVFNALYQLPPRSTEVCKEWNFGLKDSECVLFWCEVDAQIEWNQDSTTCQCFQNPAPAPAWSAYVEVVQRFIGLDRLDSVDIEGPVTEHVRKHAGKDTVIAGKAMTLLAPILLQEWETGDTMLKSVKQVQTTLAKNATGGPLGWEEICFCGTYVCRLPDQFRASSTLNIGRRLAITPSFTPQVPTSKRADIAVVFGIQVQPGSPLLGDRDSEASWSFLKSFQAAQPWAQRNIVGFCDNVPEDLMPVEVNCFLQDFRAWLQRNGQRFPVPEIQFDSLAIQFSKVGLTGLSTSKDFVWVKDSKVMATFVAVIVDFNKRTGGEKAMKYKEKWNDGIDAWNRQATRFARGAWHTSSLWVRAEAQQELISSTVVTLLIVIIMAFVGMIIFTFDPLLSLYVVIATLGVIIGLLFFIVCLMNWAIGPIEVIALIVFIGYAVTYSLHITHKYGDGEALNAEPPRLDLDERTSARYQRTGFALKSIGSAALGSAATTSGCSFFLLFCQLTIFKKLGGVVLAVTIMSITTALAPLPAALLIFGPLRPGKKCCPTPDDCEHFWSDLCAKGKKSSEIQASNSQEKASGPMMWATGDAVGNSHDEPAHVNRVYDHSDDYRFRNSTPGGTPVAPATMFRRDEAHKPLGHVASDSQAAVKAPGLNSGIVEHAVFQTKSEPQRKRNSGQQTSRSPTKNKHSPGGLEVRDLQLEFCDESHNSLDHLDIGSESALEPVKIRQALPMGSIPESSFASGRIKTSKPGRGWH